MPRSPPVARHTTRDQRCLLAPQKRAADGLVREVAETEPSSLSAVAAMEGVPSAAQQVLQGHEGAVLGVKFNKSGTYCMTCGKDRTLKLWNPHSGLLIKTYPGHGRGATPLPLD